MYMYVCIYMCIHVYMGVCVGVCVLYIYRSTLKPRTEPNRTSCYLHWVRPILEYANPVWDPHGIAFQEELEKGRLIFRQELKHTYTCIYEVIIQVCVCKWS